MKTAEKFRPPVAPRQNKAVSAAAIPVAPKTEPEPCLWAEKELRNQDERYRLLVETMNEGLVVRDVNGMINYVNERFCVLLGYTRTELVGRLVEDLLDPENRRILDRQIASRMLGAQESYELSWIGKDGQRIHTMVSPKPIFDSQGRFQGSFAAIADISGLKKAEQELRESEKRLRLLSAHLLKLQDEEAARLARELHDELGQDLTILKYQTRFIARKLRKDQGPLREACREALARLDSSMDKIRHLSRELSPHPIRHLGVTAALAHLVEDFGKHSGMVVAGQIENIDKLLPSEAQINLYRIFREALTNVARHAAADRIDVGVVPRGNSLFCWLEDNGQGFELPKIKAKTAAGLGLGLITMEERARMLGGRLTIRSHSGVGTRIALEIPVAVGDAA